MYRDHTVGVVVPAYDEEGFVGDVVRDVPGFVDLLVLVDDASTDGTWREMGEAMAERSRDEADESTGRAVVESDALCDRLATADAAGSVVRLRHRDNRGAGGAVKTGYLAALEAGVDVIATLDGDGQMDADRLPAVLDPIVDGRAGYAKGNRFAGTDVVREMPPFRLLGNVLLTGLTRIASGYLRLSDPQNGYTAVSRDALREADVGTLWEYYGYMNQLVARLNAAGVRIADVPMPATYGDEESGIDYYEYIRRVSGLLLVSFLGRLRAKYADPVHPVLVGYGVGGATVLAGAVGGVLSAISDADVSRRAVAGSILVGSALAAAAAALDGATEPTVDEADDDGRPVERREETDRPAAVPEGAS